MESRRKSRPPEICTKGDVLKSKKSAWEENPQAVGFTEEEEGGVTRIHRI